MADDLDELQVVPLRESEVWGDEQQEDFLRRAFGLTSVVAVDGARIPAAADGATEANFVAGVGGHVFDVSFQAGKVEGLHRIGLRVEEEDLEATLLIRNGAIVVLGLPERASTMAFLALSPRFEEFAPPEEDEPLVLSDGGDFEPPVLLERTSPSYPPEARRQRVEGRVVMQAVIREDGTVDGVQVLSVPDVPGGEYLVEAAASAVRDWRYLPAQIDGEPVNVYFTFVIHFTLRSDSGPGADES
jgi:TonB family protein